jgi:predicted DsbA family dithiol-disulfide isomerase
MSIGRVAHVCGAVFSFAAAVISYQLLLKHVGGTPAPGWFEAGCSDTAAPGGANCAAVLASPYSYFPPKKEADGRPHVPTALLGLVYYSGLLVWLGGVGRVSPRRRGLHAALLLCIGVGLSMSVYYTAVMFGVLDQWCPWCVVTHGLNLLIAGCAILMWPRRRPAHVELEEPFPRTAIAHPSTRLVMVTIFAIVAVTCAEVFLLGVKTWKRQAIAAHENYNTVLAAVNRLKGDPETLVRLWQSAAPRNITLRPDDPARLDRALTTEQLTLDAVVFSDFECPSCARFAAFLDEQVQPLFAGNLRVVFKHYPLDRACNERASKTMHKHACEGATLAEAARLGGGNEAFWRAHDYIFQHREVLVAGKFTSDVLASGIGVVDPKTLASAMTSDEIRSRINEDVEQARLADVRGTPSVFVDGRLVDTLAVTEIGFWDRLADMYWKRAKMERPASTRLKAPPTPSSPVPKDAS